MIVFAFVFIFDDLDSIEMHWSDNISFLLLIDSHLEVDMRVYDKYIVYVICIYKYAIY